MFQRLLPASSIVNGTHFGAGGGGWLGRGFAAGRGAVDLPFRVTGGGWAGRGSSSTSKGAGAGGGDDGAESSFAAGESSTAADARA